MGLTIIPVVLLTRCEPSSPKSVPKKRSARPQLKAPIESVEQYAIHINTMRQRVYVHTSTKRQQVATASTCRT